jgi:hypothetical protein
MTVFHLLQVVVAIGIAGLVLERIRVLCWRGPVDVEPVVSAMRALPREEARRLLVRLEGTFVARVLWPIVEEAERGDREVALEEALVDAKHAIVDRLAWIRVAGTLSTFLGFVGAAYELGWVYTGDHGLLGLDPARVAAIGMGHAMMSIALGIGGSSFALGSWAALRPRARTLVAECERVVDRLRALGPAPDAEQPRPAGARSDSLPVVREVVRNLDRGPLSQDPGDPHQGPDSASSETTSSETTSSGSRAAKEHE